MITIALIAEVIATLLATWFYYKYKNTRFKYILLYLWVMIIMENLNSIVSLPDLWQFVRWNLFGTLSTLLFMWMFKGEIQSTTRKNVITGLMIIVVCLYLGHVFLYGFRYLNTVSTISEKMLLITTIAIYAADLFSRTYVYRLSKDPIIWIAISFLILSTSFPVIQTAKLLFYGNEPLFSTIILIMAVIVVTMYAVLSFGFIWSEKRS